MSKRTPDSTVDSAAAATAAAAPLPAKRAKGTVGETKEVVEKKKQVRVWCDGCYDMMHFGHANSLRQAKAMGDYLIVGVHSDEDIRKNKGPTVMNEEERYAAVRACKWVDEVVENAPYVTTLETLDAHGIDFCVHGDDITTAADGTDCYHIVKSAGRYRECKRTQGVSTTDLVGRMLLMTKRPQAGGDPHEAAGGNVSSMKMGKTASSPWTGVSGFLPTTQKILQFSEGTEPRAGDVVGYMPGAWDVFHVGHISALDEAKKLCDFLIVGIHSDEVVNSIRGDNYPIMTLHERTLSVLANRHVDEVVIGAPWGISDELLSHFNITKVFHRITGVGEVLDGVDAYALPKSKGIFTQIKSPNEMQTKHIVRRIIKNRLEYEERNDKKEKKELKIMEAEEARRKAST